MIIGFALSLTAWILGRGDLKAIANGEMDPKAQGQTKGGWLCGIIGTCLPVVYFIVGCLVILVWFLFIGRIAASSAH